MGTTLVGNADRELSDLRRAQAFPTLSEDQIQLLAAFGNEISLKAGQPVWEAGATNMCMFLVKSGEMEIRDGRSGEHIATHSKGSFSGDVDVFSGRPVIVSAVAQTDLVLLKIASDCVKSIVGEHPALGQTILDAFLVRRALLQESEHFGALVIGSKYCPDTLRVREFLARNRIPFEWEDPEDDSSGLMLQEFQVSEDDTPVVVLPTGNKLFAPTNEQLADELGIRQDLRGTTYDLVIVGAGPAGLAAAVYGASEGLSTLVVDSKGPGGQAGMSSRIENYMGFPSGVAGQYLADSAVAQAERFGARLAAPMEVDAITCNPRGDHEVNVQGMGQIKCKCVILTPGALYHKLGASVGGQFEGRGVYYAATHVERILCGSSNVAIVGGGNSAGQAAVFMAETARHAYLVVRGDSLRKTMSSYLARRIENSDRITVLLNSEIFDLQGDGALQSATIVEGITGAQTNVEVAGVFVMIGCRPNTDWLPAAIARDKDGFILTGEKLVQEGLWKAKRQPFFLETSCPGVFAAGDARAASVKRVASAVGEGSIAVSLVHQCLSL